MSHRSRAPRGRQHVHCDSCYSRRCRARVEPSVCCAVIPCRLHCGALFHLCKEDDHLLLCPNVRVPCLNAQYGCPLHLPRSSQAAHLQLCPASVVCCSMEWIRWPSDDTSLHCDTVLREKVLQGHEAGGEDLWREEALDLAMALVDQSELYKRLKMKTLYPELLEDTGEEVNDEKQEEREDAGFVDSVTNGDDAEESLTNAVEDRADGLAGRFKLNTEKYKMSERMFSKEKGGCAAAQANQGESKQNPKSEKTKRRSGSDGDDAKKDGAAATSDCVSHNTSKTGLAPWQEGVMERLGQELTPQEYNMYVVHHGRMLVSFGQIQACTPREKDFVYGSLEPIPVQTLRSFKVPDSYHYRQRVHLYDVAARAQSETRSVDTSDLGAKEEDWFSEEAAATLLGYAEKEIMGHKVSESKGTDGLYVDVGTQTHRFRSAPFAGRTTLADTLAGRPQKLQLQLQTERVNSRHNRASSVFTFLCGHTFHRREFATHFRNVHSDIQTSLSGWFEQRCPLSYLGCTYIQRRFQPSTHRATISYNHHLRSFNLRPTLSNPLCNDLQPFSGVSSQQARGGGGVDWLSSLPFEVLCHMAAFLDSLSLSQLALVSQLMRQVCSSLLQDRGMVTLRWEKKTYSHGGAKWRSRPVWEFSHLFSPVNSWQMADVPPISDHLRVCPYYETCLRSEPVALPSMGELQEAGKDRPNLVQQFKQW